MDFEKDKNYLEDIEKNLYKKDREFVYERQRLTPHDANVKTDWGGTSSEESGNAGVKMHPSLFLKLFFLSLTFFVVAAAIAFYRLIFAPGLSPDNVEIVVQAPASVEGGEETSIQIIVTNNNKTSIESASLDIIFPDGARFAGAEDEENYRHHASLGPIAAGESVTENLSIILFGEENTEKEFDITLEYRIEGSSAVFSKGKLFPVALSTSPVSLSVSIPAEVNVGEEISIKIRTTSNSNAVLPDFMVLVDYPFGF